MSAKICATLRIVVQEKGVTWSRVKLERDRGREVGRWRSVDGGKWKWKPKTQTDIGIVTSLVNPLTGAGASV